MPINQHWGQFRVTSLPTEILVTLRDEIKAELWSRKKAESINEARASHLKIKPPTVISAESFAAVNTENLLSIDHNKSNKSRYLPFLIAQDWGHLFTGDFDQEKRYCVYAHVDPSGKFVAADSCGGNFGGMPFYIGKGCGNRPHDLKRNQAHGQRIANVVKNGFSQQDIVKIIKADICEKEALELEAKFIYFFGTAYDDFAGPLVNLDRSKRPEFVGKMVTIPTKKASPEHWIKAWKKGLIIAAGGKSSA